MKKYSASFAKSIVFITIFSGVILWSCGKMTHQGNQGNNTVLTLLEKENPYDSSNCYSYVLIDESQDSTSLMEAIPALKKNIAARSKKNCRTHTILFVTAQGQRKAIFESGYSDHAHNRKYPDAFTYYDNRYVRGFRMD